MKGNMLIEYIKERLFERNRNFIGIFVGETGSGKSFSALHMASQIDPNFERDCKYKIIFSADDLYKLLNEKKLKQGDCILWEEMGVAADSRKFYTVQNQAVTYFLETGRALNIALLMTVPGLT